MAATDDAAAEFKAVIDLLWTPPATPRRGPKPGLTLSAIAQAGIDIADADGLAAVTMQRVAEALGVTKMALYRYVGSKTELVALMTDAGLGQPLPVDDTGDWRSRLDAWTLATFERFLRHPWSLETTAGVRVMGPNELGWTEQALSALNGTGLHGSEKFDVVATLAGHARNIAQQAGAAVSTSPERGLESAFALVLRGREEQFPALVAAIESTAVNGGQDQALRFGLDRILDGIELLINARS